MIQVSMTADNTTIINPSSSQRSTTLPGYNFQSPNWDIQMLKCKLEKLQNYRLAAGPAASKHHVGTPSQIVLTSDCYKIGKYYGLLNKTDQQRELQSDIDQKTREVKDIMNRLGSCEDLASERALRAELNKKKHQLVTLLNTRVGGTDNCTLGELIEKIEDLITRTQIQTISQPVKFRQFTPTTRTFGRVDNRERYTEHIPMEKKFKSCVSSVPGYPDLVVCISEEDDLHKVIVLDTRTAEAIPTNGSRICIELLLEERQLVTPSAIVVTENNNLSEIAHNTTLHDVIIADEALGCLRRLKLYLHTNGTKLNLQDNDVANDIFHTNLLEDDNRTTIYYTGNLQYEAETPCIFEEPTKLALRYDAANNYPDMFVVDNKGIQMVAPDIWDRCPFTKDVENTRVIISMENINEYLTSVSAGQTADCTLDLPTNEFEQMCATFQDTYPNHDEALQKLKQTVTRETPMKWNITKYISRPIPPHTMQNSQPTDVTVLPKSGNIAIIFENGTICIFDIGNKTTHICTINSINSIGEQSGESFEFSGNQHTRQQQLDIPCSITATSTDTSDVLMVLNRNKSNNFKLFTIDDIPAKGTQTADEANTNLYDYTRNYEYMHWQGNEQGGGRLILGGNSMLKILY